MKFVRHFFSLLIAIAIFISILSLVVYNVVNNYLTNPNYLIQAAKETSYAENAAKFVENQLADVADSFGLSKELLRGTISVPENVYDEIDSNITAVFAGERTKVDTSRVKQGIAQKIDLPFGITDGLTKAATTFYTATMNFEVLKPGLKEVQPLLSSMSSLNILMPVVLIVCLLVLLIINRKHKRSFLGYVFIPILLVGVAISIFTAIYFSSGQSLPELLSSLASVPISTFDVLSGMDFAMNLIKSFADSLVNTLSIYGLALLIVGGIVSLLLMFRKVARRTA